MILIPRLLTIAPPNPVTLQVMWKHSEDNPLLFSIHYACPVCGYVWLDFVFHSAPLNLCHRHCWIIRECVHHGHGLMFEGTDLKDFELHAPIPYALLKREFLASTHGAPDGTQ